MEQLVNLYNKAKTLNNNQLRKLIRSGDYIGQTAGLSKNMLQTNLIILEKQYALDFMIFCQRNPKACPLVAVTNVGDPFFKTLGNNIDVRTDVPSYNIYENGNFNKTVNQISELWNKNLFAFAIGCSFTFEHSLLRHGFSIDHIRENKVVPMYSTNIKNQKSGPFENTMVVSMTGLNNVERVCKVIDIKLQKWNFVALTLWNRSLDILLDDSYSHSCSQDNSPSYVGSTQVNLFGNDGFNGRLSNLYFYNYARTTTDTLSLYYKGPEYKSWIYGLANKLQGAVNLDIKFDVDVQFEGDLGGLKV